MIHPIQPFVQYLLVQPDIPYQSLDMKIFAGVPFLYFKLQDHSGQHALEVWLDKVIEGFTSGTIWTIQWLYIRSSSNGLVYKFSIRSPNQKSFCCGNQCPNCILFRD
ncbi:hypothetical protein IC620_01145 [Hazenella sp. IB182357]|uniref:Uncharacterized protein n=1 Tax=Polycladospora coralii TaxID=2771432 RepID=A0A926NCL8_9BACL|nr:hypothetical protein [Polycladospora coralii]MBD1370968.1 hypothetical protein [Polycladospora coralii]MBS7529907.1 hypothetical protein [Polycladospora coralii]